jgi:membrane dipeptidase
MTRSGRSLEKDALTRRQLIASTAAGTAMALVAVNSSAQAAAAQKRITVNALDASKLDERFVRKLREAKVDCVNVPFESLEDSYRFIGEFKDQIILAKSVSEIRRGQEEGRIAVFFNSQESTALQDALSERMGVVGSFKDMAAKIRAHKSLGLGVQGLCYNVANVFGGGCLNHEVPLSRAGQRLVEAIHDNQIVLDIGGHTGERTSLDAIEASAGIPVICSHTNFAALNPNARAISDKLARAIAATGGVIGITAVSAFHTRNVANVDKPQRQATLGEHLDHYDHAKKLVGIEHIGIGPDFILGTGDQFEMDPDDSTAFPPWVMGPGKQTTVKDFEDISKLPNVIAGLKARGWSEPELDKLLGGNWLRVFGRVWGA